MSYIERMFEQGSRIANATLDIKYDSYHKLSFLAVVSFMK